MDEWMRGDKSGELVCWSVIVWWSVSGRMLVGGVGGVGGWGG